MLVAVCQPLPVLLLALAHQLLQALAHGRELLHHLMKLFGVDAHQLHVIERGAGGGAGSSAQQPDLAEISAAAQIRQHQLAARMGFRDLHEAQPDQIKAVGHVALAANHVALGVAHQLHFIAQHIDELLAQRGEHRHAAQMIVQRALADTWHPAAP